MATARSRRMMEREFSRRDVCAALLEGEIIEEYPDDVPFPSALFLYRTGHEPIHVVAAFDTRKEHVFIITVYRTDTEHFEADDKTRR